MAEAGDRSRAAFSTTGDLVSDVRRIVVLRANGIGDFIVTLPALEAVRAAYPQAEITLLGLDWHAAFLAGRHLPVDRVVAIPEQAVQRQPEEWDPGVAQSIELLASEGWDLALQLHGGGRQSNRLIERLRPRVSAGMRTADAAALDRWLPYVIYQPEIPRLLEAVSMVGAVPVMLEPRLQVTPPIVWRPSECWSVSRVRSR